MANIHDLPDADLEDNGIYQRWYEQNRACASQRTCKNQKYGKNVAAGMAEQRDREKAYDRTLWVTKSNFFNTYEEFLEATRTAGRQLRVHIRRL